MYILSLNKKVLVALSILLLGSLVAINVVYAANSHSIDFELSSSQYLSVADSASLSITGDITVEAWVKLESIPANNGEAFTIVAKWAATGSQRQFHHIYEQVSGVTRFRLGICGSGTQPGSCENLTVNADLGTGSWKHVAMAWKAASSTVEYFINGVSIGTATGSETDMGDKTSPFEIGALESSNFFDGLIDDVRVWDDVRTTQEIVDNYKIELAGTEGNLQGYWKLNNGLLDETSNNNDLTNNNSASFSTDIPEVTAPTISNLQSSNVTDATAVITWATDESADSKVNYGTVSGSLTLEASSTPLVTSHSKSLTGLQANTTYYYVAVSTDDSGNTATSSELSFTTLSASVLFAHKTQDQATSTQAILFVDDDLIVTLDANSSYVITAAITASSTATQPDIKMSFNAPPGASMALTFGSFDGTNKVAGSGLFSSNSTEVMIDLPSTGLVVMHIDGVITTGSTAGTVEFEWAQNTSHATEVKVFKGSYLRAEKIQ